MTLKLSLTFDQFNLKFGEAQDNTLVGLTVIILKVKLI